MARRAMITPLTMYNADPTVFDGINLPDYHFPRAIEYDDLFLREGWTLDKQTLIDNLLLETAELDTLYTDPEFFKFAVKTWAHKEYHIWAALYETMFYKYNPIWNKDGTTKGSEKQIRDLVASNTRTKSAHNTNVNNESENISDSDDVTDNTTESRTHADAKNNVRTNDKNEVTDGTNINSVSAYDSMTAWANRDKTKTDTEVTTGESEVNVENQSGGEDATIDCTSNRDYNRDRSAISNSVGTETEEETVTNTDSGNLDNERDVREYGNIGVTTTQQMIEAERNLVKFNIYDFIIDSFKARFCVLVY